MSGRGGYQAPAHPAPTSAPGALSQRTDGGPADRQAMRDLPNAKYGEQKANLEMQGGAPMAGMPSPQAIPLGAPTNHPDEPVTAGSPMGAGVGPEAAGIDQRTLVEKDAEVLKSFLPALEFMAQMPDASPSTVDLLRRIKGNL